MSSEGIKQPLIWRKAATNSSQNGNNDETAASAEGTSRIQSATASATIRTRRSPRKMKTQIAKQVYDSSITKLNRELVVNENEMPVAEMEFHKKREDRDKEVKEIQEMLNEITNTPTKEKKHEEEKEQETKEENEHQNVQKPVQRSKTETNLRQPTARRSLLRLGSQTVRSKSATVAEKENTSPKNRQKAYNSLEARRYMQEQKKKRKSLQTVVQAMDGKPPIDRIEIKKRLDNLRANTRKILDKNVKMAKKKAVTIPECVTGVKNIPKVVEKQPNIQLETLKLEVWPERPPKKKVPEKKQQKEHSPLLENYIKVGLLRKPEIKDHSFSAIKDFNIDKENLILDILSPPLSDIPALRLGEQVAAEAPDLFPTEKRSISIDIEPIRSLEQSKKPTHSSRSSSKSNSIAELNLKIPEAKLESRKSLREKSVQVDRCASKAYEKTAELPYWLKPTAVQAYPYNFIMAVRKKLEAIANPPAVASSSSYISHRSKKRPTDMSISNHQMHASSNVKRAFLDNEEKSMSKSFEKSPLNKENLVEHQLSKSLSEVTSNFSSISIQLPDSNTLNSFKSKSQKSILEQRKPLRFDDDDTTVSSSVFSSPEKKKNIQDQLKEAEPLSPLSMQNISNLQVRSRAQTKNITLSRGDAFADHGALSSRLEGSVDFSQLLDDFNRSLSQVIEVNHQLKTTLVKSHEIFSPQKSKRSTAAELESSIILSKPLELTEYVSDFEESSNNDDKNTKNPNETRVSSNVPEVQTVSHNLSLDNAKKSSSSNPETAEEESPSQSSAEEIQSQSNVSLATQTFVVSSAEAAEYSPKTQTIYEEPLIEESPNKENMSANQYSRDSLELSPREEYIKSHVNTSRGDFQTEESEQSAGPPPSYKASSKSQHSCDRSHTNFINSSLDIEFVRVFNNSDIEISVPSLNRSLSESTVNYSSIGLYEKLIQNETNKSDHLAALLKMREKAIIDRTKGQIAWLEVQKERYKAKGLTIQISTAKKKQRGILMKMEKEREEIKKLLQQTKVQRNPKLRIPEIRPSTDATFLQQRRTGVHQTSVAQQGYQQQHQQTKQIYNQQQSARSKSSAIVRGYELETSRSLEQLLQKREEDLRRRREHVERLMEWHRRLDQEEAEVLQLEQMLLDYNNANVHHEESDRSQAKMEKKLKEIDRSLRELNSISGAETSADAQAGDFVRTTGSKLNKLWRRLTSQRTEKFEQNKRYKLCKADLEQLYEEAKLAVLHDFGENAAQMEVFLGHTSISSTRQSTVIGEVPQLDLNFSSEQSDADLVRGNYSPCAVEEEFLGCASTSSSSCKEGRSGKCGKESNSNLKRRNNCGTSSLSPLPLLSEHSRSSNSETRIDEILLKSSESLSTSVPNVGCSTKSLQVDCGRNSVTLNVGPAANEECIPTSVPESVSNRTTSTEASNSKTDFRTNETDKCRPSVIKSISNARDCVQATSTHTSTISSAYDKDETVSPTDNCTQYSTKDETSTPCSSLTNQSADAFASGSILKNAKIDHTASSHHRSDESEEKSHSTIEEHFSKNNNSSTKSIQCGISNSTSNCSQALMTSSNDAAESHKTTFPEDVFASNSNSQPKISNSFSKSPDVQKCDATNKNSSFILPEDHLSTNSIDSISTRLEDIATRGSSKASESLHHSRQECDSMTGAATENSAANIRQSSPASIIESAHSENKFYSNVVSSTEAMHLESYFSINGHQEYEEWPPVPIPKQTSDSSIESAIPQFVNSAGSDSELNEETAATLRSIKSIDNSTNSKHSSDKLIRLNSADLAQSSKESDSMAAFSRKDATEKSITPSYSSAFEFETDANSSHQFRSQLATSPRESPASEDDPGTLSNAFYESDFTEDTETNIDDLSLPKFETTAEGDQFNESQLNNSLSSSKSNTTDLERRLIDLDVSLKDLDATFEKALSPEKSLSPPRDNSIKKSQQHQLVEQADGALMPDIISEVELRRRQQVMLENEMKQFEHAVPYMYVREIPNKPPPPYVPPAHGSPMTTIFPSEERIKDITYRRTKELYHEILNMDATDESGNNPPSVLDENITNIYERIILDICKEYLNEYEPVLTSTDPNNFHSSLAFFNPPNRLKCMQDFIYKEVRKSLAMDKNSPKRNQVFSVYGHRGKRDHIGEIIIQEMFEEDDRWSNFYVEEGDVLELIIDEMIGDFVRDIATAVLEEKAELPAAADDIAL